MGSMKLQLLPDVPNTVRNFVHNVRNGLYDGVSFFRVSQQYFLEIGYLDTWVPENPNRKRIFSLWPIPAEKSSQKQERGIISARQADNGTTSWYFFITSKDNPALDGKHVPFAKITDGLDVLDKIAAAEVDGDKPKQRIEIKKISIQ